MKSPKIMTGYEFKKKYPDTIFLKLIPINMISRDYVFNLGLNIDTNFDNINHRFGLHFSSSQKIFIWKIKLDFYGQYNIFSVDIPDDAIVRDYEDGIVYNANKIIISEI